MSISLFRGDHGHRSTGWGQRCQPRAVQRCQPRAVSCKSIVNAWWGAVGGVPTRRGLTRHSEGKNRGRNKLSRTGPGQSRRQRPAPRPQPHTSTRVKGPHTICNQSLSEPRSRNSKRSHMLLSHRRSHTARARAAPCGGACGGRRSRCAPPLGVGSEAGREGDAAEAGEPIDEAEPLGEDRAVLRRTLGEGLLRLGQEGGEQRRLDELLVAHLVRSAMVSRAMVVEPW